MAHRGIFRHGSRASFLSQCIRERRVLSVASPPRNVLVQRERKDVRILWLLVGPYDDTGQLLVSVVFDWGVQVSHKSCD